MNKNPIMTVFASMIIVFILNNFELIKKEKLKFLYYRNWKSYDIKIITLEFLNFILPAFIATVPMAVIGYFPPRAFLAYELMFVIVLAKNVTIISEYFDKEQILAKSETSTEATINMKMLKKRYCICNCFNCIFIDCFWKIFNKHISTN